MTLTWDSVTAGYTRRTALKDFNLHVERGEVVALSGPSGCGKTTAALVAAALLPCRSGRILVDGLPQACGLSVRAKHRRRVQLVFQSGRRATDPSWTLEQIITVPAHLAGRRRTDALEMGERCGLGADLLRRRPAEVSDGQLQRACLARALVLRPDYLLCDEATASLDAPSTAAIAGLITDTAKQGMGVLAITHDNELSSRWADRQECMSPTGQ